MKLALIITVVFVSFMVYGGTARCAQRPPDTASLNAQLLLAARWGDNASIRRLLKSGADIEAKDEWGSTALAYALHYGHADAVKLLLEKGADPVAGRLTSDELIGAAGVGNYGEVRILLERGIGLKILDEALFKMPALAPAVRDFEKPSREEEKQIAAAEERQRRESREPPFPAEDYFETTRLLLEHGANIEARDEDGFTPLMTAAMLGQTGVVRALLQKGANVEAKDKNGNTALIVAACECAAIDMAATLDSMKLLLENKADVNARGKEGSTALMVAALHGRTDNARLLLDKGAEIEARDNAGNTALLSAASALPLNPVGANYTADTIELLLARGANIEARNNDGDTALILAASEGGGYEDVKVVQLLLDRGADIGAKDKKGYTALELAAKNGRTEIVGLLRKAAAKSF